MALLLQLGFNGISTGCSLAIIAMSFGLIYKTTGTFHVAHSIVFVSSAYFAYFLFLSLNLPVYLIIPLCTIWAAMLGMGIYYFLYKPIYKSGGSALVVFITSLAMTIIGENLISLIFNSDPKQIPQGILTNPLEIGKFVFSYLDIIAIICAIFVFLILIYYLNRTYNGRLIKAVASDPELATCKGINTEKVYLLTYALGSVLVMPAGILIGLRSSITPGMGSAINLIAVMAVIFGGIGNVRGAFFAALILSLIRNISLIFLDASWLNTITYGIFLIVIMIWPTGIFGEKTKY
jgi:branched-chain amino acid transport system permease protein